MPKWLFWILGLGGAGAAYLSTRAYGALRGAVKLTSKKPAVGLTFWLSKNNPPQWRQELRPFGFVTVKTMSGTKRSDTSQSGPVIEAARAAGVPVHSWGWANARSVEEAAMEGSLAAQAALELGAPAHWVNAEHQWAGGYSGEAGAPDPLAAMAAYVQAFRQDAPGIILVFNGTTSWISSRLKGLDEQIASLFDVYGPMIYSSGSEGGTKTMRKKWALGHARAKAVGIPYAPMIGSGRQDKKGNYWSNLASVAEIQAELPADWIAVWMAPGRLDRIYTANQLNPSLADFSRGVA